MPGRNPDPRACCDRDHRRARMPSTRANAAASSPASTMSRRSWPSSITIRLLAGGAAGGGGAFGDAALLTTTAGTNAGSGCSAFPSPPAPNDRRHVSSNDREIPAAPSKRSPAAPACSPGRSLASRRPCNGDAGGLDDLKPLHPSTALRAIRATRQGGPHRRATARQTPFLSSSLVLCDCQYCGESQARQKTSSDLSQTRIWER